MNLVFAAPLELDQIERIRKTYPHFQGAIPKECKYWSEHDLHLYFSSNGQRKPKEVASAAATGGAFELFSSSALLSRLRQRLAEAGVNDVSSDYRSLCRHLREIGSAEKLPSLSDCTSVERLPKAPTSSLRTPCVLPRQRLWPGRRWNSSFWRREYGAMSWKCRSRAPLVESDLENASALDEVAEVAEFVDYMRVVQFHDASCEEDQGLAFPRFLLFDWPVFYLAAEKLLESSWQSLGPPALKDYSHRWVKHWSCYSATPAPSELQARLYRICLAPPGGFVRLHRENFGAHAWYTQIEGRCVFFLFPPQGSHLSEELSSWTGDPETILDHAQASSPVDIFRPHRKQHAKFGESKARIAVLHPGEALIIPGGWWSCHLSLESSVLLHHPFWNVSNRGGVADFVRHVIGAEHPQLSESDIIAQALDQFYERLMDDCDPEDSD